MHRRPAAIPSSGWIIGVFAVVFCPSCHRDSRPDPRSRLPDAQAARRAVESALAEWRAAPPLDLTTPTIRPVMFVDQQRRPGRPLRAFAVLGQYEAEKCLRFRVRLSLADPDESILVDYYVFGKGPIWVYRAEDFDMTMHMDRSMVASPDPAAGAPKPRDESKTGPGPRDHAPPGESSGKG
jgi:hypothetical protein